MKARTPLLVSLTLPLAALLGLGCAQLPTSPGAVASMFEAPPLDLSARGPGTVFASVEAAAVDALTHAYIQAYEARDLDRMRAGTIFPAGDGYTYGELQVAHHWRPSRVTYTLAPGDVARFQIYARDLKYAVNRANETPSRVDRRTVDIADPLHRPLFILHPSLTIRVYRGQGQELMEVANLRSPAPSVLFADN